MRRRETLRPPEAFRDEGPTEGESRRLGRGTSKHETGRQSITVTLRLAGSCAGWRRRPTSGEFYDAVRAREPDQRQRTILHTFVQEAEWYELMAAWAEKAYTLRELVRALHRAGHGDCRAARTLNGWAATPPRPR